MKPTFIILLASTLLAGCVLQPTQLAEAEPAPEGALSSLAENAIRQLEARHPELAQRDIKRGLAKQPSDANLHFLNGLVYQELAKSKGQSELDLAETGYRLALEFDNEHWLAAWHLGIMQAEQKNYAEARQTLAKAAQWRPDRPEIQLALAGSAYQVRDMPVALLAAERTLGQSPGNREALRIAALSSAALGLEAKADEYAQQLDGGSGPGEARGLKDKVDQWRQIRAAFDPANNPVLAAADSGLPQPATTAVISQHWADCQQMTGQPKDNAYGNASSGWSGSSGSGSWGGSGSAGNWGGSGGSQQNVAALDQSPLSALPSPCQGVALPRMVVVDAMLIRIEEVSGFNQGVNILDGLKIVLTGNAERTRTKAGDNHTQSSTITQNIGLPSGGVTYALGIFNGTDQYAEVLARPSLVALDRMPATFFSGSVVTLSLVGNFSSNVADKPIGVSLAVTPTFIDDDTILLAVKAGRSFIDGSDNTGSLTMSANSLSTNVIIRYGQTLILSGLRERYTAKNKTGIPVLKDIPVIQYLTSNNQFKQYAQHVMIVLTPRRPQEADGAKLQDRSGAPVQSRQANDAVSREARQKLSTVVSNFDAIHHFLQSYHYIQEVKTGEIMPRRFAPTPSLTRTLQDLRQMLYY